MKVYSTVPTPLTYTLGIDPGSKKTGLALFRGTELIWWTVAKIPGKYSGPEAAVMMAQVVRGILDERLPVAARTILEVPGKQVRSHGGAGLITLGAAVGAILYAVTDGPWEVRTVTVREWTPMGGPRPIPKVDRAAIVTETYPGVYDPDGDPGMDAADAIGLVASSYGTIAHRRKSTSVR